MESFIRIVFLSLNSLFTFQLNTGLAAADFISQSDDFLKVFKERSFIDKSLFVFEVIKGPKLQLITAPHKFGKSTNLNMLKAFLARPADKTDFLNRKSVFQALEVSKYYPAFINTTLARYPLIHLRLKTTRPYTEYHEAVDILREKIRETYLEHIYLVDSPMLSSKDKEFVTHWVTPNYVHFQEYYIVRALKYLCRMLFKHNNGWKVVVLIDDFDALITQSMYQAWDRHLKSIIKLVRGKLYDLVTYKYVERAVLMATSYITGYNNMSSMPNVTVYSFLDRENPYIEYFGFTESNFSQLFYVQNINPDNTFAMSAKTWYGGYVSMNGTRVYNPYSLMSFLQERVLKSYWTECVKIEHMKEIFEVKEIRETLMMIMLGRPLVFRYFKYIPGEVLSQLKHMVRDKGVARNSDLYNVFFSYLVHQGYLIIDGNGKAVIPNFEVNYELQRTLGEHYRDQSNMPPALINNTVACFHNISLNSTPSNDIFVNNLDALQRSLARYFNASVKMSSTKLSLQKFHDEIYHLLTSTGYFIQSEAPLVFSNGTIIRDSVEINAIKDNGMIVFILKISDSETPDCMSGVRQVLYHHNLFQGKEVVHHDPIEINHNLIMSFNVNRAANFSLCCLPNTVYFRQSIQFYCDDVYFRGDVRTTSTTPEPPRFKLK